MSMACHICCSEALCGRRFAGRGVLTRVRPKLEPTRSRRATISCTEPHCGMRARIITGLLLDSPVLAAAPLSSGRGSVQPESTTCTIVQLLWRATQRDRQLSYATCQRKADTNDQAGAVSMSSQIHARVQRGPGPSVAPTLSLKPLCCLSPSLNACSCAWGKASMATLLAMTCREPAGSLRGCNLFRLLHVLFKEEVRGQHCNAIAHGHPLWCFESSDHCVYWEYETVCFAFVPFPWMLRTWRTRLQSWSLRCAA